MAEQERKSEATRPNEVVTKDRIKLPLWMWIVAGGIVIGGSVYIYKARKASAAQQAASASSNTSPSPTQPLYADPTTILPMFQGNQAPTAPPVAPPSSPVAHTITQLNTDVFNENGWSAEAKQAPWKMIEVEPGETWLDLTSRIYGFGDNYSKVTDPAAQKRVQSVAGFIKDTNSKYTGMSPDGNSPRPYSIVVFR